MKKLTDDVHVQKVGGSTKKWRKKKWESGLSWGSMDSQVAESPEKKATPPYRHFFYTFNYAGEKKIEVKNTISRRIRKRRKNGGMAGLGWFLG